jgi:hypothetical protein
MRSGKRPRPAGSPQVTRDGACLAFEPPDGHRLYYKKAQTGSLWVQPVEGGPEQKIVESVLARGFVVEEDGHDHEEDK